MHFLQSKAAVHRNLITKVLRPQTSHLQHCDFLFMKLLNSVKLERENRVKLKQAADLCYFYLPDRMNIGIGLHHPLKIFFSGFILVYYNILH